jgi:hypothetical protein
VVGAIRIIGQDVYLLEYQADTGVMPDKVAFHFFNMMLEYAPLKCAVETISYQRILAWYLEEEMKKRRMFLAMDKIQDKRKKSDRIIQTLSGLVAYGHLYIKPSMTKLITQMDEYDPLDTSLHDDILDMLAMGVTALIPNLRNSVTVEGEYTVVLDESMYETLLIGGCP